MWCVKYSGKTKIIFEKAHKFGHLPSFWALSTQENPCTTSVYVIRSILNIDITPIRIRQHITWYRLSHIRVHALTRSQLIGHAHFPIVFILSKLFTSINVFYIYT